MDITDELNVLKDKFGSQLNEKRIRFHPMNRYITFDFNRVDDRSDLLEYLDQNNIDVSFNNQESSKTR